MKQIIVSILLLVLLISCDGIEEGIVDPNDVSFFVEGISAPSDVKYSGDDTQIFTTITFTNIKSIKRVWISVTSQNGVIGIAENMSMISPYKNDPNTFAASVKMEIDDPNLIYTIKYFVSTDQQAEKKIASHDFEYNNMQDNIAPVISNPLFYYVDESPTLRDTLSNNAEFILSIEVSDENGINDIDSVYTDLFNYQDPNNTIITRIILFDDGNVDHGDGHAGDGIYSRKGYFPIDSEGDRKFEFIAKDRVGATSNIISHNFVVVK